MAHKHKELLRKGFVVYSDCNYCDDGNLYWKPKKAKVDDDGYTGMYCNICNCIQDIEVGEVDES